MDNLVLQILEVDRVAISLGKINIYWYSILILTGILIAYCIARKECKNIGIMCQKVYILTHFLLYIYI